MKRCNFYIDGFNIYHRLRDYHEATGKNYRWLDYRKLCQSFLYQTDELGTIYFFTAINKSFGKESTERHNVLIQALASTSVKIVKGYFSHRKEKQTDINIATRIFMDAITQQCDKCFLFSGDNDFAPVLQAIRDLRNRKLANATSILIPPPYDEKEPARRIMPKKSKNAADEFIKKFTFSRLDGYSLPEKIKTKHGNIIKKPEAYDIF